MSPAQALLLIAFVCLALGLALAVVAVGRGARRVNWSTAKSVAESNARRISAVGDVRWPSSEERAVRRLEGESIPSRFDRW